MKSLSRWFTMLSAVVLLGAMPLAAQVVEEEAADLSPRTAALNAGNGDSSEEPEAQFAHGGDNFKSPKAEERYHLRQEALKQRLAGKKSSGKVHEVAKGQFVELDLQRNDRVFVLLVEYGNQKRLNAPAAEIMGPAHNLIPEPNRTVDNSSIWQADYARNHYVDMYFNRMVDYYGKQSSGQYTINGEVTEWVKVPFNGSRYGNNGLGDAAAWTLIADGINLWTKSQIASGKTLAEVTAYLQTFDQWDRYDYDGDGNFDESDGYIDHFQIVHSGVGEEVTGGLNPDTIWSHRWAAWYNRATIDGPAFNKDGGVEFGGGWGANPSGSTTGSSGASVSSLATTTAATVMWAHPVTRTGIWVSDYTIQPENGGLGVFAHEYGHDLGLPDHYDTNGGTNSTGFWTIMSSGSYLGDGGTDIGSSPGDFNGWDKLQLGWLNYDLAVHGQFSTHKLGPAETNTKKAQAVVVALPVEKNVFYLYDPPVGKLQYGVKAYWGGRGDLIDTTMIRQVVVPAGSSTLSMRLNYQIETNWDYAYVSVSTNGGATWTNLSGTYLSATNTQVALTTNTHLAGDPPIGNGKNLGNGITGSSSNAWRLASFNMSTYAGQTVLVRLRYKTDDFVNLKGLMADEMTLGTFSDGAEAGAEGWTMAGFKVTTGVESSNAPHYYIAEYRQYRTYDKGLQTGPYTFGRVSPLGNWVDHYPYQDGMLVTYWDSGEANNNTSLHRGEGLALPIDAHPEPLVRNVQLPGQAPFASAWSNTIQSYDSPFSLDPTDAITLPYRATAAGVIYQMLESHPSLPPVSVFNDLNSYWRAAKPDAGVIVPNTGTMIRIINTSAHDNFMQVQVGPSN